MPFWRSVMPMPERMRVILKKDIAVRVQRAGGRCQWRSGMWNFSSWMWVNTVEPVSGVNSRCWMPLWCLGGYSGGGCADVEEQVRYPAWMGFLPSSDLETSTPPQPLQCLRPTTKKSPGTRTISTNGRSVRQKPSPYPPPLWTPPH